MAFSFVRGTPDLHHVTAGTHNEEHDEWQAGDIVPEEYPGPTNAYLWELYQEIIGEDNAKTKEKCT